MVALNPAAISGVTIMKMISSTSMMSIIGTTFGEDLSEVCPAPPTDIAMALPPQIRVKVGHRAQPEIWPLPVTAFWAWNSLVKIERPNSLPTLLMR